VFGRGECETFILEKGGGGRNTFPKLCKVGMGMGGEVEQFGGKGSKRGHGRLGNISAKKKEAAKSAACQVKLVDQGRRGRGRGWGRSKIDRKKTGKKRSGVFRCNEKEGYKKEGVKKSLGNMNRC